MQEAPGGRKGKHFPRMTPRLADDEKVLKQRGRARQARTEEEEEAKSGQRSLHSSPSEPASATGRAHSSSSPRRSSYCEVSSLLRGKVPGYACRSYGLAQPPSAANAVWQGQFPALMGPQGPPAHTPAFAGWPEPPAKPAFPGWPAPGNY
jgi:hypothetical protein